MIGPIILTSHLHAVARVREMQSTARRSGRRNSETNLLLLLTSTFLTCEACSVSPNPTAIKSLSFAEPPVELLFIIVAIWRDEKTPTTTKKQLLLVSTMLARVAFTQNIRVGFPSSVPPHRFGVYQ